ncbi:hypothetical protein [Nocardia higoensis]|uniref:hypothetical protein n=1 Tax=Nocardia higoensis TaxID=228599 RepID=UPI000595036D|nr:hypothetical protein [Nocardia higoensis]
MVDIVADCVAVGVDTLDGDPVPVDGTATGGASAPRTRTVATTADTMPKSAIRTESEPSSARATTAAAISRSPQ